MAIDIEKLNTILHTFATTTPDIQGVALVTPDGLPLASSLPTSMDEERVAAMSAAILSMGERIGLELTRGAIERIYVDGEQGPCILTNCGEDAVFLVLATKQSKQGILALEIKRAVNELKRALGYPVSDTFRLVSGSPKIG
ncbi:roadblock/LC7 domain-containing protein [Leptolyngbya sp. AN03gr2]|uniref:roadblock/LC7 domain-containing protein n=1 Tax=unclassified Leptolyngbya TaxID=2650499 RepID=UPI003D3123BB